ncbi:nuclear pore complex protein Nup153 isoform X1 [Osmerus eperlanus]|uniref:nuclear pore complex protein Nup153 isoform X1 n=1 Tax=Osmerus eperlanus TaxID=29151 RepID=UPI002E0E6CA0
MAATGGGKIRSRRYHIASKPYAKSKQQQQPGLISRVTDTVKSIVPSWLQKYFRNGEAAEGGGAVPGAGQDQEQAPPSNGNEDMAPPLDGRDSPEPTTSNTEPSTSRASLNLHDHVLSRPPLNRSHLHFPSLDSPSGHGAPGGSALFSQPSTSFAPPPFHASSSYSLVKEIKDSSSQHEDDNISTTSGFSSRASDKDVPASKTASLPQLWSPETDRTHSGPHPAQSSLKKPAFNLSVFGASSTSTMNSSVLSSSQLGDSPFYPGKTTYGGAAAARTGRSRLGTPYQAPVRRQMKAKPAGAQPCGVNSATARRILQSLERMSSPLADAKRIPSMATCPLNTSLDGTILERSHVLTKKRRLDSPRPPVQKLVIPSAASYSANRSMSFRPSLTPRGLARPLTPRDTPSRQSPQIPETVAGPSQSTSSLLYPLSSAPLSSAPLSSAPLSSAPLSSAPLSSAPLSNAPLSSTPVASAPGSGGGKMKRERTSTRPSSKRPDDETADVPDLPAISLPISTSSLPTFSFSSLPPATTTAAPMTPVAAELVNNKDLPAACSPPCAPFTFSSPIVMATAASPTSFSPSAGFTFSAPVAKTAPSVSNGNMDGHATSVRLSEMETVNYTILDVTEQAEEFEGPFKPAKALKQGSVLDLLKSPGFSSPVARLSPSPEPSVPSPPAVSTAPSSSGFGDMFKPPAGSWNCSVCMVQNKPSDTKCVACQSPQPSTSSSKTTPASGLQSTTAPVGFKGLFTTPAGTWDCDTCLVQNKPDVVKCVACETAKPGAGLKPSPTLPAFSGAKALSNTSSTSSGFAGFGDKFKKPEGAWECGTCMVQNKAQDSKCVACMSAKPGASSSPPPPSAAAPLLSFGDKFKKPEGSWECHVCMVQNKAADLQCVACQSAKPGATVEAKAFGSSSFGVSSDSGSGGFKFGTSSESTSGAGFQFGGSLTDSSSSNASAGGFKFGASSSESSSSGGFKFGGTLSDMSANNGGFKFGAGSSAAAASDDTQADPPSTGGFTFGASGGSASGNCSSGNEENRKPSVGGFSFGLSKPESTFGFPAASQDRKENGSPSADSTSTEAAPLFGSRATAEPSLTSTPLGGAAFGVPTSAENDLPAPSFTFGKPDEKEPFGFSGKEAESSQATSMGFSFSKADTPQEPAQPSFTFGKPEDKSEAVVDGPKPAFSFGQSTTDAVASNPKPVFGFIASTSAPSSTTPAPSLFGASITSAPSSTTPAPSLFGGSITSSSSTSAPSLFGAPITSAPAPSSTTPAPGIFGASITSALAPSSTTPAASLFGVPITSAPSSSTPAPNLFGAPINSAAATSSFLFGQTATSEAPPAFMFGQSQDSQGSQVALPSLNAAPAQPFLFGSAAGAPPAAPPSFTFGAAAPPAASTPAAVPSSGPSPFVFSPAPSAGFGSTQSPAFGQVSSQPTAPAFGAPAPSPFLGATSSQSPAFGAASVFGSAASSAPGGGFQFGGASAFGSASGSTGVFAFGGGPGGSPAPPSTPSLVPQPAAPGGGFTFAQPPAFNIGSTKNSFTPTPAGQNAIAGRKIKTAVRRRK